jgi:hypothetical protein
LRTGQLPSQWNPKIPPVTVGSEDGKSSPFRQVPDSTEPLNDLVSVVVFNDIAPVVVGVS